MCVNPNNSIFYVYVYLDPRKPGYYVFGNYIFEHEPFYVGKGSNGRMYKHLYEFRGNRHLHNKIKKIRKEYDCDPIIIKVNEMITEDEAFEIEKELICVIGRWDKKLGTLCNHTDGGDGSSGIIVSEETRQKMSEKLKEFYQTEQGRAVKENTGKLLQEFYQTEQGQTVKENIVKLLKEYHQTEQGRAVIINRKRLLASDETKRKMRISMGVTDEKLEKAKILIDEGIAITKIAKIIDITYKTLVKYFKNDIIEQHQKRKEHNQEKIKYNKPKPKYRMTYPDGTIVEVPQLKEFCEKNGITKQGLAYAKSVGKTCKGFSCEKI